MHLNLRANIFGEMYLLCVSFVSWRLGGIFSFAPLRHQGSKLHQVKLKSLFISIF